MDTKFQLELQNKIDLILRGFSAVDMSSSGDEKSSDSADYNREDIECEKSQDFEAGQENTPIVIQQTKNHRTKIPKHQFVKEYFKTKKSKRDAIE